MPRLECFFDCSSPWTYLGFHNIQPIAARCGVEIEWRPLLVGGLFNTINPSVYHSREYPVPAKQAYAAKDLQDWARYSGLTIKHPPTVFPVNSVKAMRACIAIAHRESMVPYATAVFEAYWRDDRDISQDAVLAEIARSVGLDAEALAKQIGEPAVKEALRANSDELAGRGGFGSPSFFVNGDDMYFGNDRLPLIEAALGPGG